MLWREDFLEIISGQELYLNQAIFYTILYWTNGRLCSIQYLIGPMTSYVLYDILLDQWQAMFYPIPDWTNDRLFSTQYLIGPMVGYMFYFYFHISRTQACWVCALYYRNACLLKLNLTYFLQFTTVWNTSYRFLIHKYYKAHGLLQMESW